MQMMKHFSRLSHAGSHTSHCLLLKPLAHAPPTRTWLSTCKSFNLSVCIGCGWLTRLAVMVLVGAPVPRRCVPISWQLLHPRVTLTPKAQTSRELRTVGLVEMPKWQCLNIMGKERAPGPMPIHTTFQGSGTIRRNPFWTHFVLS